MEFDGVRAGEAGAFVGVVAFVVSEVVGLAEGCCGESGLAGVALEAVAVHGFVVGATVGAGETLCGHCGW